MKEVSFVGIDGCKAGWFVIGHNGKGKDIRAQLLPDIAAVAESYSKARLILVDMPIGLPHTTKRRCDTAARKVLSPKRHSSVFPIPSRDSLYAASYLQACEVNLQLLGNKLSKQSWNIRDKMTEVDTFLLENPAFQGKIRECHPEVAFWSANGQAPMPHSKKKKEGQADRLALIASHIPNASQLVEDCLSFWPRKKLQMDDILDAFILAISASFPLKTLPDTPDIDLKGLPQEIVYPVIPH
ncbi:MAG: DUF429 domain-containing protein [Bacteroidota bacterium]